MFKFKYLIGIIIFTIISLFIYTKYFKTYEKYTMTGYTIIDGKKTIDMRIPRINLKNQKSRECFQHNVEMDLFVGNQIIDKKTADDILEKIGCLQKEEIKDNTIKKEEEEIKANIIKKEEKIKEGEIKEGEIKEGEIKEGEIKEGEIKEGEIKEGEIKEGEIKEREININ